MSIDMFGPGDFHGLLPEKDGFMTNLEEDALKRGMRICGPDVANLLSVLARAIDARRVLEIGTCVGYSTIFLARALPDDGLVTTMEWDGEVVKEAHENFRATGVTHKVQSLVGDAREMLKDLEGGSYDMVFMDHEKYMYSDDLPECVRVLRDGGTLVVDNVAFRTSGDFKERLAGHPQLVTSFVCGTFFKHSPDEDVVSVSVKVR
jgi:predicted O-methyltransferase YrrM